MTGLSRALALLLAAMARLSSAEDWRMAPVTSFQARVESFAPVWDEQHSAFVSGVPSVRQAPFADRHRAVMDSVTTSSVEGALMYLQRDCIDMGKNPAAAGCTRKNNASFITFLQMEIVQPRAAMAEYQSARFVYPEFCPFVMMEGGACIPYDGLPDFSVGSGSSTSASASASSASSSSASPASPTRLEDLIALTPPECKQFYGLDGQPRLGPCVGAQAFAADMVSPYMDTVWFSYPNSCAMGTWASGKTDECRGEFPGGLCPFGDRPDGVNCMFAYKILGFLSIDELVGITNSSGLATTSAVATNAGGSSSSASSSSAGSLDEDPAAVAFANYSAFCAAGHVEFHSFDRDKTLGLSNVTAIPFWQSPSALPANVNRTEQMIALYNAIAAADASGRMQPLPTDLAAVRARNPPCFENAYKCFDAVYGCERHSYAQVCSVCRSPRAGCVTRNASSQFPILPKAARSVADADLRSGPLASLLAPTLSTDSPATGEAASTSAESDTSAASAPPHRPCGDFSIAVRTGAVIATTLHLLAAGY